MNSSTFSSLTQTQELFYRFYNDCAWEAIFCPNKLITSVRATNAVTQAALFFAPFVKTDVAFVLSLSPNIYICVSICVCLCSRFSIDLNATIHFVFTRYTFWKKTKKNCNYMCVEFNVFDDYFFSTKETNKRIQYW